VRVDHQPLAADAAFVAVFVSALLSIFVAVGRSDSRAFFLSGEA